MLAHIRYFRWVCGEDIFRYCDINRDAETFDIHYSWLISDIIRLKVFYIPIFHYYSFVLSIIQNFGDECSCFFVLHIMFIADVCGARD